MHQTDFWKPIWRIQQQFCKNKGEFWVCMCCLMRKRSVLLLPGFIFHNVSPGFYRGNACVKGNRQHSVLVTSWNAMSNNSAFLWLKVLKSSNMGKVECVCGGALKNQWVMFPVVLRPLSASLPFLDPSRVSKEFVGSSFQNKQRVRASLNSKTERTTTWAGIHHTGASFSSMTSNFWFLSQKRSLNYYQRHTYTYLYTLICCYLIYHFTFNYL